MPARKSAVHPSLGSTQHLEYLACSYGEARQGEFGIEVGTDEKISLNPVSDTFDERGPQNVSRPRHDSRDHHDY